MSAKKTDRTDKTAGIEQRIADLEVDLFGITSVDKLKEPGKERALKLLPGAKSLVVVAVEVYPEVLDHAARGRKIADTPMKSLMESHADFLNDRLTEAVYAVAAASRKAGLKALPLPAKGFPLDRRILSSVFSYKHAAEAAGIGTLGRSSLLITPEYGPRVRLACCLTEAILQPTRARAGVCQECNICIKQCPARAISPPKKGEVYSINRFACNSYRTNSFCLDCQRNCPAGK